MKYTIKSKLNKTNKSFNTDLFTSDSEPMETFDINEWDLLDLVDTDNLQGKYKETIVCVASNTPYLLSHIRKSGFAGKIESTFWIQSLTLKGLNYFTKDSDMDYSEYYNSLLEKYGFTVEDIKEIGEFNVEYNCFTLSLESEMSDIWLTINARNQLSSITVKPKPAEAKPTENKYKEEQLVKSILG